jgi:hypothetical protein
MADGVYVEGGGRGTARPPPTAFSCPGSALCLEEHEIVPVLRPSRRYAWNRDRGRFPARSCRARRTIPGPAETHARDIASSPCPFRLLLRRPVEMARGRWSCGHRARQRQESHHHEYAAHRRRTRGHPDHELARRAAPRPGTLTCRCRTPRRPYAAALAASRCVTVVIYAVKVAGRAADERLRRPTPPPPSDQRPCRARRRHRHSGRGEHTGGARSDAPLRGGPVRA